jgi:hypothetical protein
MQWDEFSRQWQVLTEEVLTGMANWRAVHPKASFAEIEAAVDERLGRMRARMLAAAAHELKTGEPATVLAAMCSLPVAPAARPEQAAAVREQTVAYFARRWEHIQYAAFQAQGYPIGSGAVESANKLLVAARLKGSGMHWAPQNVNPLLALRCAACSGRWEDAWPQLWLQRHAERSLRRRCRATGRRSVRPQARAPAPLLEAVASKPLDGPVPSAPTRAPLMVNGRPTDRHPWKRFPLLHRRRQPVLAGAKL